MWERLSQAHVPEFPRLDFEYIRQLTLGPYQLELAPSYVQDKFEHESSDVFELDVNRDVPGFLRIRIYSRFKNATRYQLWVCFRVDIENDQMDDEGEDQIILGYYCTCKAGARTLGCCAHVASILWFLGWARHQQNIRYPNIENDQMEDEGENQVILGYYCTCKAGARTLGCCAHVGSILWFLGWARHQQNIRYPSTVLFRYILDAGNRQNNNGPNQEELIVDEEE
ncbi:hypothetical protein TSAR_011578 [Trichomalopsis sarcophagae]|uniref:SWIM-type domain-containing protein n=1 Tax=Trichomalopsis sarcophagae TaxID=543379 RepID=A0A232EM64_9HYME|nr:hypothetical protein TSAR_011578 [Trichomalopsis sarcophagae]